MNLLLSLYSLHLLQNSGWSKFLEENLQEVFLRRQATAYTTAAGPESVTGICHFPHLTSFLDSPLLLATPSGSLCC